MANKYALSDKEFESCLETLGAKFSKETLAVGYAVMVDDVPIIDVAANTGMSRQRVHAIVRNIWEAISLKNLPDDWERVVVSLPPDLAKQVYEMEKKAKKDLMDSFIKQMEN